MFNLRHPTDFELLHSIYLYFMIPGAVIMEVSTKRFSFLILSALDTILKLLQIVETHRTKYKKKTITTFRIPLTSSHFKSSQSPTAYAFLF